MGIIFQYGFSENYAKSTDNTWAFTYPANPWPQAPKLTHAELVQQLRPRPEVRLVLPTKMVHVSAAERELTRRLREDPDLCAFSVRAHLNGNTVVEVSVVGSWPKRPSFRVGGDVRRVPGSAGGYGMRLSSNCVPDPTKPALCRLWGRLVAVDRTVFEKIAYLNFEEEAR